MKNLSVAVLLLGLGLVACRGDQTPAPLSISGTVLERDPSDGSPFSTKTIAWTGGTGSVSGSIGTTVVATGGTVASNGAFSLNLPATISNDLLETLNFERNDITAGLQCTGTPNISDTNVKGAGLNLNVDATSKSGSIAPETGSGALMGDHTMKIGSLVYADRAAKISGVINCSGTIGGITITSKTTINYNLAAGWNKVAWEDNTVVDTDKVTLNSTVVTTSGKLPTDNWVLAY